MSLMPRSESLEVSGVADPLAYACECFNIAPGSVSVSEASTDDDDQAKQSSLRDVDSFLVLNVLSVAGVEATSSIMKVYHKLVRMLRTCRYGDADVVSVLAVAVCHHRHFIASLGKQVSSTERGFILLAQAYIAHCVVLDEHCCISNWHKYLFSTYCDLRALNGAVSRILKRMDWSLSLDPAEIDSYINRLTTITDRSPTH